MRVRIFHRLRFGLTCRWGKAEIKTMRPVGPGGDFGAKQVKRARLDLERLRRSEARHKYFSVTDPMAAAALRRPRYANDVGGVTVVLV